MKGGRDCQGQAILKDGEKRKDGSEYKGSAGTGRIWDVIYHKISKNGCIYIARKIKVGGWQPPPQGAGKLPSCSVSSISGVS